MFLLDFVSWIGAHPLERNVWIGTFAVWGAFYALFVYLFGSADGSNYLSDSQMTKAEKKAKKAALTDVDESAAKSPAPRRKASKSPARSKK
jgi:hypothetical protein